MPLSLPWRGLAGHEDAFYNNTCIIARADPSYASFSPGIGGPAVPVMHDNRIYTLDGKASESGKPIEYWQSQGHDLRTTVEAISPDVKIIQMAKSVLGM